MRQRVWYHCTQTESALTVDVQRRKPSCIGAAEPPTPRLCVAPTLGGCFAARLFDCSKPVHVYVCKCRAIRPRSVWDAPLTGERWVIPPMTLWWHALLGPALVMQAQWLSYEYHRVSGKPSDLRMRLCQYALALAVLGGPRWEREFVEACLKRRNIACPLEYVLCKIETHSTKRSLTTPMMTP